MDYLTLLEFRDRTGLTTAQASDSALTITLNGVEQLIQQYLGYAPQSASRTEFFNGNGTERLPIASAYPVTAVTTVHENREGYFQNGNFTADELLTLGEHYAVENIGSGQAGILVRLNTVWPARNVAVIRDRIAPSHQPCLGCIRVAFSAGLSATAMAAIKDAAYQEAQARYLTWKSGVGVLMNESLDGYSYGRQFLPQQGGTFANPFVSPLTANALRFYRRLPISN